MPVMGGVELAGRLRQHPATERTPVLFYTASIAEGALAKLAQAVGAANVLTKPCSPEVMLTAIRSALGQPRPENVSAPTVHMSAVPHRLSALLELSRQTAAERDPVKLIEQYCVGAQRICGARYAVIGVLDQPGHDLRYLQSSGLAAPVAAWSGWSGSPGGVLGEMLETQSVRRASGPNTSNEALGLPAGHPLVTSFLGIPIVSDARVRGWLYLVDPQERGEFNEADETAALTIGLHFAASYQNAMLHDAVQYQAKELDRSNADLRQFAYVASHDLQEPLRMVSSYLELIRQRYQGKLDTDADDFIGFAVDGANRMKALINDLLAYAGITNRGGPMEPVDCAVALGDALKSLAFAIQESQAQVTHDTLPTLIADAPQIRQLFQNLVGNAIKFRGASRLQVHVSAEPAGADWTFSVRDTGIGFEQQYAQRIFQMFQRLHPQSEYKGSGIGLALCARIVERHGGRIWVESSPQAGSTFFFTLRSVPVAIERGIP
jgi:signal transduction histidine kinase